jgi:membrane fusion protein (multidrug efflux system)
METRSKESLQPTGPTAGRGSQDDENIEDVPLYRKKRVLIPFLVFLVVGIVGIMYWYVSLRGVVSTDDAYIDADRVSISSKILDRITQLRVDEGDHVGKGQELVRLDDSGLKADEAQAAAALVLSQKSVTLAQVNLNRAQDDYHRAEIQYKQSVIPKEQYDHASQALAAAQAEAGIAVAKVRTAKAQLGIVESNLANTVIVSPIDGEVAKRWVLEGDVVQPGQPIFTVYDTTDVWVTANLEETKLSNIHLGDHVTIDIDAYPGITMQGTVRQIEGYAASQFALIPPNNASGNFTKVAQRVPLKISIDRGESPTPDPPHLLPGMSVEVNIRVR